MRRGEHYVTIISYARNATDPRRTGVLVRVRSSHAPRAQQKDVFVARRDLAHIKIITIRQLCRHRWIRRATGVLRPGPGWLRGTRQYTRE